MYCFINPDIIQIQLGTLFFIKNGGQGTRAKELQFWSKRKQIYCTISWKNKVLCKLL